MATIDCQPFQSPFLINFQWIAESNQPDIQTNQTWKCKNKWIHLIADTYSTLLRNALHGPPVAAELPPPVQDAAPAAQAPPPDPD